MSSGIICKIRLDPFYQEFLRGYYENYEIVFKFPREDADELEIARKFNRLLMAPPCDYKPIKDDQNTFLVEVPYFKDKDPFWNNYISTIRNESLANAIHRAWRAQFHEKMDEFRNLGFEFKDCIYLYMDEFRISACFYDRLIKDLQRWRSIKRNKKYRQKEHRLTMAICPSR